MGRKADRKQAPPKPLPGSDLDPRINKKGGKRRAPSTPDVRGGGGGIKAAKGVGARSAKDRQRKVEVGRRKKVDEVVEDESDLEDALQQG